MKKYIPHTSDRIITVLAAVVCAIVAVLAFCELLYGNHPPMVFGEDFGKSSKNGSK